MPSRLATRDRFCLGPRSRCHPQVAGDAKTLDVDLTGPDGPCCPFNISGCQPGPSPPCQIGGTDRTAGMGASQEREESIPMPRYLLDEWLRHRCRGSIPHLVEL